MNIIYIVSVIDDANFQQLLGKRAFGDRTRAEAWGRMTRANERMKADAAMVRDYGKSDPVYLECITYNIVEMEVH